MSKQNHPVQATESALDVIEYLSDVERAGVTEISNSVELSKSAVYNQLQTLKSRGYVRKDGSDYSLGYRLLQHSNRIQHRSELIQAGEEKIQHLADTIEQPVSLVIHQRAYTVYLLTVDGTNGRVPVEEGEFKPLLGSPSGQAILPYLPEGRQENIRDQWDEQITPDHVRVESMQNRDIVFCSEEQGGRLGIAAPILSINEDPFGAVEITGSESELSGRTAEVEIPGLLQNSIKSIENGLPVDHD